MKTASECFSAVCMAAMSRTSLHLAGKVLPLAVSHVSSSRRCEDCSNHAADRSSYQRDVRCGEILLSSELTTNLPRREELLRVARRAVTLKDSLVLTTWQFYSALDSIRCILQEKTPGISKPRASNLDSLFTVVLQRFILVNGRALSHLPVRTLEQVTKSIIRYVHLFEESATTTASAAFVHALLATSAQQKPPSLTRWRKLHTAVPRILTEAPKPGEGAGIDVVAKLLRHLHTPQPRELRDRRDKPDVSTLIDSINRTIIAHCC
jgi:hypothetical protein